jgi:signal transduction histidine kinase
MLDAMRIRRVLANLLSNAIKFTSAGEIVITVSAPVEGRIEIGVRDTGVGIAPEHQSLIFEQYRQAPQARPKQQRGSGLGLAIVQQLVRLHGGRVWLESTPGEGSEFFFSLPVRGPVAGIDADRGEAGGGHGDRGEAGGGHGDRGEAGGGHGDRGEAGGGA